MRFSMPSLVQDKMMKEVKKEFEANPYAFISTFQGVAVADISDLRRNLEKVAKRSVVVKHSIVRKVFSDLQLEGADKFLKNNVLVTMGDKEPQMISKTLVDFAKKNEKFLPAGVVLDGRVYDKAYVKVLAQLPSRHELLTQVVVRVKSPISGFVLTLSQLLRGFVVALNEVKRKKELAVSA